MFEYEGPEDPIEAMINHCMPDYYCKHCQQDEEFCECPQYVPAKRPKDPDFDFDEVMSRISGAWNRD